MVVQCREPLILSPGRGTPVPCRHCGVTIHPQIQTEPAACSPVTTQEPSMASYVEQMQTGKQPHEGSQRTVVQYVYKYIRQRQVAKNTE